jgi:hypothetical protein
VTTKELRHKAAAYLLEFGWTQGQLRDGKLRCCLVGVVHRVGGTDTELAETTLRELEAELKAKGMGSNLAFWNDRPHRTVDDVVALLRGVA